MGDGSAKEKGWWKNRGHEYLQSNGQVFFNVMKQGLGRLQIVATIIRTCGWVILQKLEILPNLTASSIILETMQCRQ